MKNVKTGFLSILLMGMLCSCTSLRQTMREPNVRVDFIRTDFLLSDQVSAEATSTQILGIDFHRLFGKETGATVGGPARINMALIPVIGTLAGGKTANYALYLLMQKNPGYDVVFYPQYTTTVEKPVGLGFIYKTTKVKVSARLGRLD